ncbi:MAG: hypothetical protein WAJ92_08130 [Candidatus Acidiferrales bacterium]
MKVESGKSEIEGSGLNVGWSTAWSGDLAFQIQQFEGGSGHPGTTPTGVKFEIESDC